MKDGPLISRVVLALLLSSFASQAEVLISGRVIDDTGAAVPGARLELQDSANAVIAVASSNPAGTFTLRIAEPGHYGIRAVRQGFYVYQGRQDFVEGQQSELTIVLNHQQEFADKIDVKASPDVIDPQQPAQRQELHNAEIENIPYPASRDYRNALPLLDGVVQDNSGQAHFNGGGTNQTNYTLDGFNISDPVTGNLEARVNIDTIQSMDLESSRYSAENGRGAAGVLDLKTKTGDDRFRFGSTNFVPSFSTQSGFHMSKFDPQVEFSGPIDKGRAWFHEGLDNFYYDDVVSGLPNGANQTSGLDSSSLSRFQVNLTPANILTTSLLVNRATTSNNGLTFINPVEATTDDFRMAYMSTVRDQMYLSGGSLLDFGFADTRGYLRDTPQGTSLYEITTNGNRGNYFVSRDRHYYRQQGQSNLFLPTFQKWGKHQLKFGVDFEREAYHESDFRHPYEVLRADNSVARYVSFTGGPYLARSNFEAAQYIQDQWTPRADLLVETGLRIEWNEIVRDLEVAPRFSVSWTPGFLRDTKLSAGWGIYYDAIALQLVTSNPNQASLATFFAPGAPPTGPLVSSFAVTQQNLETPYYRTASVTAEHRIASGFYFKTSYMHRSGSRGFVWSPANPAAAVSETGSVVYLLQNTKQDRYDAFDFSVRHTFAGKYEWFAGYTRSSARSSAGLSYSLENPVFGLQAPGPYPWDAPNRFHTWGWAPLPNRALPRFLRFVTNNTSIVYLLEYRTGFPFNIVDQNGFLVGQPGGARLPAYFNINLDFERKFSALHYQWAWRFGFNNITNSGNPNSVNNVIGTPEFLTYGRGQLRAFNVRLKFLGRR